MAVISSESVERELKIWLWIGLSVSDKMAHECATFYGK
jgi:hypothetical protein